MNKYLADNGFPDAFIVAEYEFTSVKCKVLSR